MNFHYQVNTPPWSHRRTREYVYASAQRNPSSVVPLEVGSSRTHLLGPAQSRETGSKEEDSLTVSHIHVNVL